MKKILIALFLFVFLIPLINLEAYVSVKGYYRKDGTYVKPHVRSEPNGLKYDNYGYKPSQGLYNSSYGTKGANWDTPTYITDPDYYVGKSLYNSASTFTPSYTPSYSLPTYTSTYTTTNFNPSVYASIGTNYTENPKYIKLNKKIDEQCGGSKYNEECAEMRSDLIDIMLTTYKAPKKQVKTIKISEIALSYAEDGDCKTKSLKSADQKSCSSYSKYKDDNRYEFKVVDNNKKYYQTCGDYVYSVFLLDKKEEKFVCKNGVASLEKVN